MEELCIQQSESGTRFDAIILASSSLGTQAGLEVGKRLFAQDYLKIIGISPGGPAENAKQPLLAIINAMLSQLGLPLADPADLNLDDRFAGPGYGVPSTESEQAARIFAETEGILLDPVYTSKAAAALVHYSREHNFKQTDRVLFWHTGGQLSLL
jgi:1-aminocyclopropane-1-carboxylate deaminase/D-cysteine desulfhydrase-like pyridoxal-dependent ACC family enzyme